VNIQRDEFKRMGILGDGTTLSHDAPVREGHCETFKDLENKGYVYRGKKPVYWCTTDETALAKPKWK